MSRTEESGARFSTDEVSEEVMATSGSMSDRTSPDFTNLANPVKLAGIRAHSQRHHDPTRRLALSPSHILALTGRHRHSDAANRGSPRRPSWWRRGLP